MRCRWSASDVGALDAHPGLVEPAVRPSSADDGHPIRGWRRQVLVAVRYAVNASRSIGPPARLVPWAKTVKPSPPAARKLFTDTRYDRAGSIASPLTVMFETREPTGCESLCE